MIWRDVVAVCVLVGALLFALRGDSFRIETVAHSSVAQQCAPVGVSPDSLALAPSARASVALFSLAANNVTSERSTEAVRQAIAATSQRGVLRLGVLDGGNVVVAVTSDLALLAFDANSLALLWESHLGVHVRDSYHLTELAVLGSSPMRTGDTAGSVVVAGRLVRRAPGSAALLLSAADEYFSFYAFDALTGALRWKHESGDYEASYGQKDDEESEEEDAKSALNASAELNARNVDRLARLIHGIDEPRGSAARRTLGELSPQLFMRQLESIVDAVGVWRDPIDTRLVPVWLSVNSHASLHSTNGSGPHGYRNVLLARHRDGLEGVHLFSGRVVFRLPLEPHRLYVDANHDARLDSVELIYTHRSDVRDLEFIASEGLIRQMGQDPDVMRRARLGSFADEVVPVLRVWADVPTSHLLFDVPLSGAQLHSAVFEILSVAQQAVSTVNREVGDVFHDSIFGIAERLARSLGLASPVSGARASRDADWDGGGHDAVPTVLRRRRESPLIVAMTRTGALYGIETHYGYQTRTLWRRRSPLLQHNVDDGGAGELASSGGQLVPIELAGEPALLASGGLGVLVLDSKGRELAAALWPPEIRFGAGYISVLPSGGDDGSRVRFVRWSHNRFSVFEIVHQPAAALRPLLILLGGILMALVVVAILVADVPSLAAQLANTRRRQRHAAAAPSDSSTVDDNINLRRGNDVGRGSRIAFSNKDL
jgi:hypothetical protein